MLAEPSEIQLTFTSLSLEAQVSRRTLYTHWGSIDRVIADAVSVVFVNDEMNFESLPESERLHYFLRMTRDRMSLPLTAMAFSTLISRAVYNSEAAEALTAIATAGRTAFAHRIGEVSPLQYEMVIGPIFHAAFIAREPLTDDQLTELAETSHRILALV